jgi:leucyl aminopeptidase
VAAATLEGAALGAYAYSEYKSTAKAPVEHITLHSGLDETAIGLDRVRAVAAGVARTKDLVNASPADLFPARLAELAVEAASGAGVATKVWDEEALAAGGFGGILGVGLGSSRGPRLVRLDYAPDGASVHLALVGKGITFDSGGLSLKPMASMVGMKTDMAGAAAVLSTVVALAELDVPIRVTGWLCLAENLPSGTAVRPNDVPRMHGGTTVEVLNTDAEGRLVLADGLVAASAEQPDAIIDVATLTGAQVVALGHRITGLMGDDDLVAGVRTAAEAVGEATWPMPLPADLLAYLKSDVADLANTKLGVTVPGMLLAGVFLREFVGTRDGSDDRIPWAHLDIAGPSNNSGAAWGYTGSGATGVAVRTLVRLGEDLAAG